MMEGLFSKQRGTLLPVAVFLLIPASAFAHVEQGQAAGSTYFKVDIAPYPTVKRIVDTCMAIDAFARAHPLKQPGAAAA